MDPVSALGVAGSVVGIASFGIQLSQMLYQFCSQVRSAQEGLQAVCDNVDATAKALKSVHRYLAAENTVFGAGNPPPLSRASLADLNGVADKCLIVFWRIEATISSRDDAQLEAELSDRLEEFHQRLQKTSDTEIEVHLSLDFTAPLSFLKRLRQPYIKPRLDGYCTQLQLYQGTVNVMVSVMSLMEQRMKPKQLQTHEDIKLMVQTYMAIHALAIEHPEYLKDIPLKPPQSGYYTQGVQEQTQAPTDNTTMPKEGRKGPEDASLDAKPPPRTPLHIFKPMEVSQLNAKPTASTAAQPTEDVHSAPHTIAAAAAAPILQPSDSANAARAILASTPPQQQRQNRSSDPPEARSPIPEAGVSHSGGINKPDEDVMRFLQASWDGYKDGLLFKYIIRLDDPPLVVGPMRPHRIERLVEMVRSWWPVDDTKLARSLRLLGRDQLRELQAFINMEVPSDVGEEHLADQRPQRPQRRSRSIIRIRAVPRANTSTANDRALLVIVIEERRVAEKDPKAATGQESSMSTILDVPSSSASSDSGSSRSLRSSEAQLLRHRQVYNDHVRLLTTLHRWTIFPTKQPAGPPSESDSSFPADRDWLTCDYQEEHLSQEEIKSLLAKLATAEDGSRGGVAEKIRSLTGAQRYQLTELLEKVRGQDQGQWVNRFSWNITQLDFVRDGRKGTGIRSIGGWLGRDSDKVNAIVVYFRRAPLPEADVHVLMEGELARLRRRDRSRSRERIIRRYRISSPVPSRSKDRERRRYRERSRDRSGSGHAHWRGFGDRDRVRERSRDRSGSRHAHWRGFGDRDRVRERSRDREEDYYYPRAPRHGPQARRGPGYEGIREDEVLERVVVVERDLEEGYVRKDESRESRREEELLRARRAEEEALRARQVEEELLRAQRAEEEALRARRAKEELLRAQRAEELRARRAENKRLREERVEEEPPIVVQVEEGLKDVKKNKSTRLNQEFSLPDTGQAPSHANIPPPAFIDDDIVERLLQRWTTLGGEADEGEEVSGEVPPEPLGSSDGTAGEGGSRTFDAVGQGSRPAGGRRGQTPAQEPTAGRGGEGATDASPNTAPPEDGGAGPGGAAEGSGGVEPKG